MRRTQRIVVVGGGILGTMHAVAARRRGYQVTQLEREAEARGASVRNFGLVWVSGRRPGPELALALRARELWAELGAAVPGLHFRAAGSLTLAADEAELRPAQGGRRPSRRRPARRRAAGPGRRPGGQSRPARRGRRRPAVPGRRDRRAAAGPARAPLPPGRARLRVAARARGDRDRAQRGARPHGRLASVRPGHPVPGGGVHRRRRPLPRRAGARRRAPGAAADDADCADARPAVHRRSPTATRCATTRPTTCPAAASCRRRRPRPRGPGPSCCMVQRADGGLTIGDTHEYDEPFAFDVDSDAYDHLQARAEALLGGPSPGSSGAGPGSTARSAPARRSTTGPSPSLASSWSPARAGAA